jgi:NNP family nitrate/nitrite transporter-like MFS transporter
MNIRHKATAIRLLDFSSVPMRTFHMTWIAFFLCFFGWFGLAPLMPVIRDELHLTKEQVGNSIPRLPRWLSLSWCAF